MDNFKDIETMLSNIEQHLFACKVFLTFDEAAKYVGLSKNNLQKLTSAGQILHYKPNGKQIYFHKGELDRWLLNSNVQILEQ